ncbi:MAG: hypothetical protein ACFFFG_01510 [Candidatus Thorarchaeota archaeon]
MIEVDLSQLFDCKQLEIINLEGNPLKQVDIGGLRQCPMLTSVKVDETVDLFIGGSLGHLTIHVTSLFQHNLQANYNLRGILLKHLKRKIKASKITPKDFSNLQLPLMELITNWEVLTNLNGYRNPELSDAIEILGEEFPSFLAPAYHFNQYLNYLSQDVAEFGRILPIRHIVPFNAVGKATLNSSLLLIEFEDTLISLKIALDRFVRVLIKFFPAAKGTTFGGINKKEKSRGFMSEVVRGKEGKRTGKNAATWFISTYIYDQYFDWIQDVVIPRDELIHYFGALLQYKEIANVNLDQKTLLSTQHWVRIRKKTQNELDLDANEILVTTDQISGYVTKWYEFFFYLLKYLPGKRRWELEHTKNQEQSKTEQAE